MARASTMGRRAAAVAAAMALIPASQAFAPPALRARRKARTAALRMADGGDDDVVLNRYSRTLTQVPPPPHVLRYRHQPCHSDRRAFPSPLLRCAHP